MQTSTIHQADAVTTKEISGVCIPTIPSGTPFKVNVIVPPDPKLYGPPAELPYSSCNGLPVSLIWKDEFRLV